jgi:hypothetical protein
MAWAKPDLVVSSFTLTPSKPSAATAFKIEAVIENKGADRAGSRLSVCSFEIYAYADGQKIGSECDSLHSRNKARTSSSNAFGYPQRHNSTNRQPPSTPKSRMLAAQMPPVLQK